jgi:hypothetical protein
MIETQTLSQMRGQDKPDRMQPCAHPRMKPARKTGRPHLNPFFRR